MEYPNGRTIDILTKFDQVKYHYTMANVKSFTIQTSPPQNKKTHEMNKAEKITLNNGVKYLCTGDDDEFTLQFILVAPFKRFNIQHTH